MIKKIKQTYYVFITQELLDSPNNLEVGINLHLVIIPKELKEKYDNSNLKKVLSTSLIKSKGGELILCNTSNEIGNYFFE